MTRYSVSIAIQENICNQAVKENKHDDSHSQLLMLSLGSSLTAG